MTSSPVSPAAAARELLRRRRARADLRAFARAIEVPGRPASDDDDDWIFRPVETALAAHHDLLLRELQRTMSTPYGRLMVFMPPGSAKSTYCSVVAPTWFMGREPERRVILASYGSDLARRHGRRARQVARQSAFSAVFGGATISTDTSAADEWALTNGSEYLAGGILSGITGNRAHGLIIDDPVRGRDDADSEVTQQRTYDAYQDDLLTRLVPGGWCVIVQTRWNHADLAGRLLPEAWAGESGDIVCRDGQTWRVLCVQAQCERADDPLGRRVGEYLWPEWFTEHHWSLYRANARTWTALYQQMPTLDTGGYFQRDWFHRYERAPKHLRVYGASDYAVTEDGGNYTEHGVFGLDPEGDLYVLDWWSGQTTSDVWVETQLDLVDKWRPVAWIGEAGPIRSSVEPFLRRRMRERKSLVRTEWLSVVRDKPTRARPFQAMAASRMVYLPIGEIGDRLLNQLIVFNASPLDDKVDVCSLIGRYLDQMRDARVPEPAPRQPARGTVEHMIRLTDEPERISPYRSVAR